MLPSLRLRRTACNGGERSARRRTSGRCTEARRRISATRPWAGITSSNVNSLAGAWATQLPGRTNQTGLTMSKGVILVPTANCKVVALNAKTGEILWEFALPSGPPDAASLSGTMSVSCLRSGAPVQLPPSMRRPGGACGPTRSLAAFCHDDRRTSRRHRLMPGVCCWWRSRAATAGGEEE